ncbi:xanthine dehydrogenase family protein molybdopterin-binding subunit [Lutibaculum baratangense]|uniref:Putative carbon monoxide dehydrogenase large subunit transmembrane protein n=1 Tax=Lutibaculum baratangense AMV1 TaxID=631454 RepID=V4R2G6_9HYPH|nr:xanthine dehydrogenase family protein molybdopterin-binding subunit [Lutibaculum baratangense]ESR26147.1 putative carbon monoxide dehydrogenase large subunit transmembrane protein [Lutibaculum baratangense AMV1]
MSLPAARPETRLEDEPLLRGMGRYTGDRRLDDELALVVVRSAWACGRIVGLDVAEARQARGVLAVLTPDDLPEAFGHFAPRIRYPAPGGGEMYVPPYPVLTRDRVRYVGDPVAAVVAETLTQAEAAAELVLLDVEEEDALVDPEAATEEAAPPVWPDCPGNVAFRLEKGDRAEVERLFAEAAHVVRQRLVVTRVTAAPIEPRSAIGLYDPDGERYTLRLGTQSPHRLGEGLAPVLGVAPDRLRVVAEDTGGSFGMKNGPYPEYALVLLAARLTGRPVRWSEQRNESFMADSHSREQVVEAALALDPDGRFSALDVRSKANLGAYLGTMGTHPMTANIGGVAGVYDFRAISVTVDGVFTNTQGMAPYRGAGRPEATYVVERMADLAALEMGIDAAEIRRRNLVRPEQMPYRTPLVFTYDCGDFPAVMEEALQAADWAGFAARRAASAERGRLRGIGLSNPIEIAGGPAANPNPEFAAVGLAPDGALVVELGSGDTGQGHATTFGGLLSERLGIAPAAIRFVRGDTAEVSRGTGTFGSRTTAAAGTALSRAADAFAEKLRLTAADMLEAGPHDIEILDGRAKITGTDRAVGFAELAATGADLRAEDFSSASGAAFPNGCHVCEVEIDPETGETEIVRYTVVDDVGTVLNHTLVDGQIHGGIAQGAGQALMEHVVYEPRTGQLVTASFQDYAMPRAADFPSFSVGSHPVPTANNPLGVKGVGEAGVVGALPAVINAVCNALAEFGVRHLDMPATPERVWRAIEARAATSEGAEGLGPPHRRGSFRTT